jgi:citrate synthase
MTEWISATDAAARLGIKPASLYSYVSRGVLARRKAADGRSSLFDAGEVEALARRARPRRRGGPAELLIETAITELGPDAFRYRGHDVTGLARHTGYEQAAELLWTGQLGAPGAAWRATPAAVAAGTAAQQGLPPAALPLERLAVIVPALAAADPLRLHLGPPAVAAAGRAMIAGMAESLPLSAPAGTEPAGGGIPGRLALRLCPNPLVPGLRDALRAAMVLLADHELAASTFAARVAASVRADPYAVVAAGLGVVGGALHGGASLGAETMLAAASGPRDAPRVIGELLRRGERIPGFGHFVYHGSDPRAALLLDLVRAAAPGSPVLRVADTITAEAARRGLPGPNIDFALAVLARTAGMIRGAAEAVFAIARTAGWLAHALEEYQRATPIRPRGLYTGRFPG